MFRRTFFRNERYLVTRAWRRHGSIAVYIKPLKLNAKATAEETAALCACFSDLVKKGVRIKADNEEVQQLILAMAGRVERRVMLEFRNSLWGT